MMSTALYELVLLLLQLFGVEWPCSRSCLLEEDNTKPLGESRIQLDDGRHHIERIPQILAKARLEAL